VIFSAPYAVRPLVPQIDRLLEALPLGLALIDGEGRLINCNQAFVLSVGGDLRRGARCRSNCVCGPSRAPPSRWS